MGENTMSRTTSLNHIVRADEVIGVKVINANKDTLGKIYQIVINKTSGQVEYVVLDSGSFLGLGGKYFALPWNAIHYDVVEEAFIANIEKEVLKNAPGFDKDDWPEFSNERWGRDVANYYTTL